jgi:hypothetical protein
MAFSITIFHPSPTKSPGYQFQELRPEPDRVRIPPNPPLFLLRLDSEGSVKLSVDDSYHIAIPLPLDVSFFF